MARKSEISGAQAEDRTGGSDTNDRAAIFDGCFEGMPGPLLSLGTSATELSRSRMRAKEAILAGADAGVICLQIETTIRVLGVMYHANAESMANRVAIADAVDKLDLFTESNFGSFAQGSDAPEILQAVRQRRQGTADLPPRSKRRRPESERSDRATV